MGTKERRERQRTATRQGIIQASLELAGVQGWNAVTIRAVAAAVEYSPALIYEYFPSKEAILIELMREGFRALHEDLSEANLRCAAAEEPERAVETVGLAYWDFAAANPAFYQIMHGLAGVPFGTDETPAEASACFKDLYEPIAALLAARGGASRAEAEEQVELYWAFLHGLVSLNMNNRIQGGTARASRLARRLVREFVRGCVPEADAEP